MKLPPSPTDASAGNSLSQPDPSPSSLPPAKIPSASGVCVMDLADILNTVEEETEQQSSVTSTSLGIKSESYVKSKAQQMNASETLNSSDLMMDVDDQKDINDEAAEFLTFVQVMHTEPSSLCESEEQPSSQLRAGDQEEKGRKEEPVSEMAMEGIQLTTESPVTQLRRRGGKVVAEKGPLTTISDGAMITTEASADGIANSTRKRPQRPRKTASAPATMPPSKKKSRVTTPPPAAKKSKKEQSTEEDSPSVGLNENAPLPVRGKKRRQPNGDGNDGPPIITNLPPLPWSPSISYKSRSSSKSNLNGAENDDDSTVDRTCEFCNKRENICCIMRCSGCRRMYHAQCLVNCFRSFCAKDQPIETQLDVLRTVERRGALLRCAPCQAAFVEYYRSGGLHWECKCPTCVAPEKLVVYRRRTLLKMIQDLKIEKKAKQDRKKKPPAPKQQLSETKASDAVSSSGCSNALSHAARGSSRRRDKSNDVGCNQENSFGATRSRRSRIIQRIDSKKTTEAEDGSTKDMEVDLTTAYEQKESNDAAPPIPIDDGTQEPEEKNETVVINTDVEAASVGAKEDILTSIHDSNTRAVDMEITLPVLDEDQLYASVNVSIEGNYRHFKVACTKTPDPKVEGKQKSGMYQWHSKEAPTIKCECCGKVFRPKQFVDHTDAQFMKEHGVKPMQFLFVHHHDEAVLSPLDVFLKILRNQHGMHANDSSFLSMATKSDDPPKKPVEPSAVLERVEIFKLDEPVHSDDSHFPITHAIRVVGIDDKFVRKMMDDRLCDRTDAAKRSTYPWKEGWLSFCVHRLSDTVRCICCHVNMTFDQFVDHADIEAKNPKYKLDHIFVPEKSDNAFLIRFEAFSRAFHHLLKQNKLESFLKRVEQRFPTKNQSTNC